MSRSGKVTVVGAGFYGSTTALRLAEYNIFETVVLTDIVEGKSEGLALDINQSRSIENFETKVIGATTNAQGDGYEKTANSDVVVITAGLPRKPGMSRMDLIGVNAGIVRGVAENIAKHSPNSVIIVVSNPLDEMTALTQLATKFSYNKVIGQAGMLDTARFTNFVAEKCGVEIASVKTLTLGSHGETMVPVPSRCTVNGKALSEVLSANEIADLVDKTRNGGAEIVALLKTGSAYSAPSAAALACFFIVRDGKLITPHIGSNILESITRDTVITLYQEATGRSVVEREIDRSELYFADEAFLCGTGQEIIPIVQIDRLPVGDGTIGVQTRSMQKIYFETVRGLTPDVHGWLTPV